MKRTSHYSGTILWNALPSNLKTVKNVDIFKKKYFEYLLLQQEHYQIYFSIPFKTCCVSVQATGNEIIFDMTYHCEIEIQSCTILQTSGSMGSEPLRSKI